MKEYKNILYALLFIGVFIAMAFVNSAFAAPKQCPTGYFSHTFSAGDAYCIKLSSLNEIGGVNNKLVKSDLWLL